MNPLAPTLLRILKIKMELLVHLDEGKIDFSERWMDKLKSIQDLSPDQLKACFPQLVEVVEKINEKLEEVSG